MSDTDDSYAEDSGKARHSAASQMFLRAWNMGRFTARWIYRIGTYVFFPLYFVGITGLCLLAYAARDLPPVDSFWGQSRPVSVSIVDRHKREILTRGAKELTPVSMKTLSPHLRNAVLATEDRRFYTHVGVDPLGLARALQVNLKAGRTVQGGSTLTQQLAKNVFLTSDKTLKRKLQESMLAIWLEYAFSKDEIFEKYLNRVYFGGHAWGLEAGSQQYFKKSAQDLELGEAAIIAGLLKGPSRYNPISHPQRAGERTALVLSAMERYDYITKDEQRSTLLSPIHIYPPETQGGAEYFTDWVWSEIEALIGTPQTDIIIQTTLDIDAQRLAEASIEKNLDSKRNATQAAIITLDGTGGVQAMVGGASYADSQFNRAVQANRQPGSAFKPFVYLAAFNAGLTPWDMRIDAPIKVGDWQPRNFSKEFRGNITLETAFALSINTVAVVLSEEVGRDRVIETAGHHGLEGLKPLRSLPLGAQGVTPLALTQAYLPFANWGDTASVYGIISITTDKDEPLYNRAPIERERVLNSRSLGHINRLMTHAINSGTGRRARLAGRDVAGKTGTTNDYRDAWFVGYVPDLVTGVWVGNDDNSPMKRVTGGSIPAQIWHDMMEDVVKKRPPSELPVSTPPVRVNPDNALNILLDDIQTSLPAETNVPPNIALPVNPTLLNAPVRD